MKQVFQCTQCGQCCQGQTTVSLDQDDQRVMLKHLGISREEALQTVWREKDGQIQMRTQDGHCIFYVQGCSIHGAKPKRCKQWPLIPAIIRDYDNFLIIRNSCPGILREISYEEICSAIKYLSETD